jgi:hypothetical protein
LQVKCQDEVLSVEKDVLLRASPVLRQKYDAAPADAMVVMDNVTSSALARVRDYCFPEQEMQVLTNRGFFFLRDLLGAHYDAETLRLRGDSGLLIASFDSGSDAIRYERCERLVLNLAREQELVEFAQRSDNVTRGREAVELKEGKTGNDVSLLVTSDHDMWGRRGRFVEQHEGNGVAWKPFERRGRGDERNGVKREMEFVKAGDLVLDRAPEERLGFQFRAFAKEGLIGVEERRGDYTELLEIDTEEKDMAFLKLYGYWIGSGSLGLACVGRDAAVLLSPVKKPEFAFLERLFEVLGLVMGSDVKLEGRNVEREEVDDSVDDSADVATCYSIVKEAWWRYFRSHYDTCGAKRLLCWVCRRDKTAAAAILEGMRCASGDEAADENTIYTDSVASVDDIMRLGLQAGFSVSASFGSHRHGKSWSVSYAEQGAEPTIDCHRDVRRVPYSGRTWCVTVPSGKIFVRRVRLGDDGAVSSLSSPVVVGNCLTHAGKKPLSAPSLAAYDEALVKLEPSALCELASAAYHLEVRVREAACVVFLNLTFFSGGGGPFVPGYCAAAQGQVAGGNSAHIQHSVRLHARGANGTADADAAATSCQAARGLERGLERRRHCCCGAGCARDAECRGAAGVYQCVQLGRGGDAQEEEKEEEQEEAARSGGSGSSAATDGGRERASEWRCFCGSGCCGCRECCWRGAARGGGRQFRGRGGRRRGRGARSD